MRLLRTSFIILIFCLATSPAPAQSTADANLQAKMDAFLRTNIPVNMFPERDQKIIAHIDSVLAKGSNPVIMAGADRTANHKGLYALTFGEELHTFELSTEQSHGLGLRPQGIVMNSYQRTEAETRLDKPVLTLSQLKINNANGTPGDKEITGSFLCKPTGQPINGAFSLSIVVKRPRSMSRTFQGLSAIPASGVVPFSIRALNRGAEELEFGPTPILVDILISVPGGKTYFASNTVSMMVNVLPDVESFAKNGLQVMNQFTDLLASVKDRESAARGKEEYVRIALQLSELVTAMERIGAQTPQQAAEFDRQHGAELEAMAKRMEAEVTRLEKADYAGEAFFDDIQRTIKDALK